MKSLLRSVPASTGLFFVSLCELGFAGFWIGCLFTATETRPLMVVDVGLALWSLFQSAKSLREGLVSLIKEVKILHLDCR